MVKTGLPERLPRYWDPDYSKIGMKNKRLFSNEEAWRSQQNKLESIEALRSVGRLSGTSKNKF